MVIHNHRISSTLLLEGRDATSGFEFFEKVRQQDPLDRGKPSEPCGTAGLFNKRMDELVAALHATLAELQKESTSETGVSTTPVSSEKQIFFAEVPESMRKYRRSLIGEDPSEEVEEVVEDAYPECQSEHAFSYSDKPFIRVPKKLDVETVSPLENLGSNTNNSIYKGITDEHKKRFIKSNMPL